MAGVGHPVTHRPFIESGAEIPDLLTQGKS